MEGKISNIQEELKNSQNKNAEILNKSSVTTPSKQVATENLEELKSVKENLQATQSLLKLAEQVNLNNILYVLYVPRIYAMFINYTHVYNKIKANIYAILFLYL